MSVRRDRFREAAIVIRAIRVTAVLRYAGVPIIACLAMTAVLSAPAPAQAAQKEDWQLDFSFDGSGSTAGKFDQGLTRVGVDQAAGYVYVLHSVSDSLTVSKFDTDGNPANFSSTGTSSLTGAGTPQGSLGSGSNDSDITIDNSGGASQGRIYVNANGQVPVNAFDPSGVYLWQIPESNFLSVCGTATDKDGYLWAGDFFKNAGLKFDRVGSPPALIDEVSMGQESPCRLNLDASGNLYLNLRASRVDKYVNGEFDSTLDPKPTHDIAIDQSSTSGRIYTINSQGFTEFTASGAELGFYGGVSTGVGIAYHKALDRLYVADAGTKTIKVFKHVVGTVPDATVGPASNVTAASATLSGTVNPQGVNNDYRFEWKEVSQSWEEAESSPAVVLPADSSDHPVSHEATGLSPNTAYHFRIVVRNTDLNLSATSEVGGFGNLPVEALGTAAAPRTDTTARLNGFIDPGGNPAKYHFEYSADGVNWVALPEGQMAASADPVLASSELSGLQQDTPYRYRLVAETLLGSDQSDEVAFSTRSASELALAQRGIEMVSNADKGTQNALAFGPFDGTSPMSSDGNEVLWTVLAGAPGSNTGSQAAFLAQRTSGGWQSKSLVPQAAQQVGGGRFAYRVESANPDFSKFAFLVGKSDVFLTPPQSAVRLDPNGVQDVLATYQNPVNESSGLAVEMTDDGTHFLAVNTDTEQLEELGGGTPVVVGLMPDGSQWSCELGSEVANSFKGPGGRGAGPSWQPGYRRIAGDASRVYFEAQTTCDPGAPWGLYVRNRDSEETTLIDAGTPVSGAHGDANLIRVTPDGRRAFFATFSQLDSADANAHGDVYRWDEETESSTCLTCQAHPDVEIVVNNQTLAAVLVSDDFSRVYFSSRRALAPGAKALSAQDESSNVYALGDGELRYVGSIDRDDPLAAGGEALLSADGNVLAFIAQGGLTTDAVTGKCDNPASGNLEDCQELYRYDDRDGSLECLSCARGATTTHSVGSAYALPQPSDFQLSGDGSTVAFAAAEKLVPLDVNNDIDIYEWRNGALRLITDGVTNFQKGVSALQVRALDHDGSNILFAAVAPGLTGFEHDGLASIYDARIGGGFEPPAPPVHCVEEACQGPLDAVPTRNQPSSAAFDGRGNVARGRARRRCAKGKVRRRGRGGCVKRRQGKKRHSGRAK